MKKEATEATAKPPRAKPEGNAVTLRLSDEEYDRLERKAKKTRRTPGREAEAMVVEGLEWEEGNRQRTEARYEEPRIAGVERAEGNAVKEATGIGAFENKD